MFTSIKINETAFQSKAEQDTQTLFAPVTLTFLVPITLIYDLDSDIWRRTCVPKMNFLGQGFQQLDLEHYGHGQTDIQTDAAEYTTRPHSRVVIIYIFIHQNGSVNKSFPP